MLHGELTDALAARIQKEVGTFLSLKDSLLKLQSSSDPIVRTRATNLLPVQTALEEQLKDVLTRIDNIQKGAYTISDITVVGVFATAMEKQVHDVRALGGVGVGFDVSSFGKMLLVGLGVAGAVWGIKRVVNSR